MGLRLASFSAALLVLLLGCGGQPAAPGSTSKPTSSLQPKTDGTSSTARPTATAAAAPPRSRPDEPAIFARLKPELVACYEKGRRAVPTMVDGKLTLNASIDTTGKTTCVIPTDDKGLTQEVEDCMSASFAKERFDAGPAWTVAVPVTVRGGSVELGARGSESAGLESVETHRMADAFEVLESLVPELQACVRELDKSSGVRSVTVGARIAVDGRTQCALAAGSPVALPSKTTECTENVFRLARFPPPSGGPGLILVPIAVMRSR